MCVGQGQETAKGLAEGRRAPGYPVVTQALPVLKHHHPGFRGCLLRARLEGCPAKGKRPWTWAQEPQRAGSVSSAGHSFPSVKICVPAEVAGTWGGK